MQTPDSENTIRKKYNRYTKKELITMIIAREMLISKYRSDKKVHKRIFKSGSLDIPYYYSTY